jgi:glycosyltransferase involved in cell wall biosynthesis
MLAWNGASIRIMGGNCLQPKLAGEADIALLPVGSVESSVFLQDLDVFFYRTSPQLHEAAGRVVMEALACGLPVVAHTSGGYTDWIKHGENGFLFERQEEAWQHLIHLKQDVGLRERLGHNARQTAEDLFAISSQPTQTYLRWLASG